ncbi:MAG: twin-arginine translocase TatA/TatE family subunit [Cytophagales bacterium]|nr:twin-arginine translocase TatA/TatE family subunit [Cytophaga sp.]
MTLTISSFLFLQGIGMPEIILILLLVVFLFGAKKIPDLARGLGRGIREFKDASKEVKKEIEDGIKDDNNKA